MNYIQRDHQLRQIFNTFGKKAAYGTAGFRDLAERMEYVAYRVGVAVAVLSLRQPQKHVGVVVSASHNKRQDNGIKITNYKGNMLQMQYQPLLEAFVNQPDLQVAVKNLKKILIEKGQTLYESSLAIMLGGDTRPSTDRLFSLIQDGAKSQGSKVLNFGLTTTPQLQYYVYLANVKLQKQIINTEDVRQMFWNNFSEDFIFCSQFLKWKEIQTRTIDCANGVGAIAIPHFKQKVNKYLDINLINTSDEEYLNKDCGADYVKTNKLFPRSFKSQAHNAFLSFDGDADRIVFYTQSAKGLQLIDGDRIGTVITQFYKKLNQQLRIRTQKINQNQNIAIMLPVTPSIGFVQTYYANYSSSQYLLKQYNMEPAFAATGVKYLHEKAQHYDIGVYFEANGHGTVIFNQKYLTSFEVFLNNKNQILSQTLKNDIQFKKQIDQYISFVQFYYRACTLNNPSVGDAICVFLVFQLALQYLQKNYSDVLALYTDLQSLTSKIAVKRKQLIKVTKIQDKVVYPENLQPQIQKILSKHEGKKAFLRASGTQNVLRLHVEAKTKQQVKAITEQIKKLVEQDKILN